MVGSTLPSRRRASSTQPYCVLVYFLISCIPYYVSAVTAAQAWREERARERSIEVKCRASHAERSAQGQGRARWQE